MIAYTEASAFPVPYSHNLFLVHFGYAIYEGKFLYHQTISAPFLGTPNDGEVRAIICAYQFDKQLDLIYTDYGDNVKKMVKAKKTLDCESDPSGTKRVCRDLLPQRLLNILQRVGREDKSTDHYERYNRLHVLLKERGRKAIEKFTWCS